MIPMINTLVLFMLFLSRQAIALTKNEDAAIDALKTEIIQMDSLLFGSAFNQYDVTIFRKIISDDVEFYDDRYGLNVPNDIKSKALIEKYTRPQNVTRKLNSCTIDKLGDFGAVQLGEHTFFINGIPNGTGKFIHIWERKGKDWKLKRIVSYEHKSF
ncbi:uncharacterized protein DUF4440 [Flavobacterium sp. 270]|uniref:DUF4440 domain-containing protein n=1 Tax=Flavobacterium sp. 270 TaxID=2512114 RepID=UPI0010648B9D|nr:DUF4440 domain-containing protein [Flavobacterium sp. 270]TDW45830.1 uncharacterized protein DUF4440 [Flavobacterium sp. 270]